LAERDFPANRKDGDEKKGEPGSGGLGLKESALFAVGADGLDGGAVLGNNPPGPHQKEKAPMARVKPPVSSAHRFPTTGDNFNRRIAGWEYAASPG
jgi:hypothetical protein